MKATGLFQRKTTFLRVTSASIIVFIFIALLTFLYSCQNTVFPGIISQSENPGTPTTETMSSGDSRVDEEPFNATEDYSVYSFDFNNIEIRNTGALDLEVRNCNLYVDMYGDLIILGEVLNNSGQSKTDIVVTVEFIRPDGELMAMQSIPSYANYLQPGKRMPFYLVYTDRKNYRDISAVEIGVNYNNYNKDFEGQPIISGENFYYEGKMLVISGSIMNIGRVDIEDLKLLCTFYDLKDRVVFIKEGFLEKNEIETFEKQDFEVKVLLDEYVQPFTHYRLGVFFRDAFNVEEI